MISLNSLSGLKHSTSKLGLKATMVASMLMSGPLMAATIPVTSTQATSPDSHSAPVSPAVHPTLLKITPQSTDTQPLANTSEPSNIDQPINQIVAVVNQSIITQHQLDMAVLQLQLQASSTGVTLSNSVAVQKQALKSLIFDRAAMALAAQDQITVSEAQVDQALAQIAAQNHVTPQALLNQVAQSGITPDDYRQTLKTQLTIRALEQQVIAGSILITPQEIDDYLKNQAAQPTSNSLFDVAHILIAFPSNPTPEQLSDTEAKAQRIFAKLKAGMDFTQAAIQYSDSPDATQGGDLGYLPLSQLPTLFASQVQNMKPHQLAGPFKDSNGYHIILLKGIHTPPPPAHFVSQYHLQAITIETSPSMNDVQAKILLLRLTKAAAEGVPFDTLVEQNSPHASTWSTDNDASSTETIPGDLGWLDLSKMSSTEAAAISATAVNQITAPFPVAGGWRIVKVLGIRQQDNTQAYLREQAQEALFAQQAMKTLTSWKSQLLGQCIVQIKVPALQMAEFEHPKNDSLMAP